MNNTYSSEKAILILVALLKQHGIKKVIACPGGTNMMLNACLMYDGGGMICEAFRGLVIANNSLQ